MSQRGRLYSTLVVENTLRILLVFPSHEEGGKQREWVDNSNSWGLVLISISGLVVFASFCWKWSEFLWTSLKLSLLFCLTILVSCALLLRNAKHIWWNIACIYFLTKKLIPFIQYKTGQCIDMHDGGSCPS